MRRGIPIFVLIILLMEGCTDTSEPGIESLVDPNIKPKVIYTYPPMNSQGPYENLPVLEGYIRYPIKIRFNKIMDEKSVLTNFSLTTPNTTYKVDIDNPDVFLIGGDQFQIQPYDTGGARSYFSFHNCKIHQEFTMNISSGAKDISGNILTPPFSMTFVPEPYFRVKGVSPKDGTINFLSGWGIEFDFNSQIDNSFFSFLDITPDIDGYWRYNNDSTRISLEYTRLSASQLYTISIRDDATDRFGNRITDRFTSKFTTRGFGINYVNPSYENIDLYRDIYIHFTCSIDTSVISSAFSFTPDMNGIFSISRLADEILFQPESELLPYTYYTVRIDTTLKSINGYRLEEPYIFSFTTTGFKVKYRYPYGSQGWNPTYTGLEFTANLDTGTIASAFSIDPPTSGILSYEYDRNYITFHPDPPFEYSTTYTVTIDTTLRSIGGIRLSKPFIYSFSIQE